jgi:hypothetical protein
VTRGTLWSLVGLGGLAATGYASVIRPWMLQWGSTTEERARPLPGDDIEPDAKYVTTRAVTIRAPAASIWPWLVQMGQDRAGFYTHNWVERLLQSGIPDTSVIRPEWQQLRVGDLMRTNRDIGGKPMGWPVAAVDPGQSRTISRDVSWSIGSITFAALIYEPLHAYMETGLINGVRRRAEALASGSPPAVPSI